MKKKMIILLVPFLLTGCFGKAGRGELSNTCIHEEKNTSLNEVSTYNIDFKEGKISNIKITKDYDKSDIIDTLNSEKNVYGKEYGVIINVDIDNYIITYEFDMNKISKDIKNHFLLNDNYNEQIKRLKENGYSCK